MDLTFITTSFTNDLATGFFLMFTLMTWSMLGMFGMLWLGYMQDLEFADSMARLDELMEEEKDMDALEDEFYQDYMVYLEEQELEDWANSLDWDALEMEPIEMWSQQENELLMRNIHLALADVNVDKYELN